MATGSSTDRGRRSRRRRRRRRSDPVFPFDAVWPWAGAAVGGILLGYLLAVWILFPAPEPPEDLLTVPDLRGATLDVVRERLAAAELSLGITDELRHPQVDSGTVMGQSPLPGQLAGAGESIRVTLSLGPERRTIPDVSSLREDQAVGLLQAGGFIVQVFTVESMEPRGSVLRVDPEVGTELPLPAEVSLQVSMGPPAVVVPSLLGFGEGEARDTLEALGLEVEEVEEVFRFGRDQGRVVGQDPPAGEEVERGSAVRLTVGRRGSGGRRDH